MALRKLYSTKNVIFNTFGGTCSRKISISIATQDKVKEVLKRNEIKPAWDRALSEGEKCVGHQKTFVITKYLLNNEVTNWSEHMEKLEGSKHPMYNAARDLLQQGHNNINQTWGLVVLLVSKMAGFNCAIPESEIDEASGLLKTQKMLSEIVETTCSGNDVHREGVLNMQNLQYAGINLPFDSELIFGNKMAILGGDILLGRAAISMSKIRDHDATILLCTAARDVADSNFIGDRDIQNKPLPSDPVKKLEEQKNNPLSFDEIPTDQIDNSKPFDLKAIMGSAEDEWKLRETLAGGTLLGKSCQAALMLSKHSTELQKEIYFFGKHLYLGWKASQDLELFASEEPPQGSFSLVTAPVLFHLEYDHSLYDEIKKGLDTVENVDYAKIYEKVRSGPGLEKTRELLNKNNLIAKTLLHKFPPSTTRRALENIIVALEN